MKDSWIRARFQTFFWYNVLQLLVKIYHSQFLQFLILHLYDLKNNFLAVKLNH